MTENTIPVRLANFSDHPQVSTEGQRIASVKVTDPDTFVKLDTLYERKQNNAKRRNENVHATNTRYNKPHVEIDFSSSQLTVKQKQQMQDLVDSFHDCFVDPVTNKLGHTTLVEHKIELKPDSKPIHKYPYRISPKMRTEMKRIVQEQVDQALIEETTIGAYASPALLVKKKGGDGMRLVVDYRGLNDQTIDHCLVIPRLDSILDDIGQGNPKFFSSLDLQGAFHQIALHKDSKALTAFLTPHGKFQ